MAVRELVLVDEADQIVRTNLGGQSTIWRFRYNEVTDRWNFDLTLGDVLIIVGRRIVLDVDLLAPLGLGIGSLFAFDVERRGNQPDRRSLPDRRVRLFHEDP